MTVALMSVQDVADHVGLSERTIRAAVADGELAAVKLRGRLRFHPSDVAAWLDEHRTKPPARLERELPVSVPRAAAPEGGYRAAARRLRSVA